MRHTQYLVISCGSSHLSATHLSMGASGRCELEDYHIEPVQFQTNEPLLWLKSISESFRSIRKRIKGDMPVGFSIPGNLVLSKYLKIPQASPRKRNQIIAFEAKQNIPYPIGEVTWDDYLIDEDDLDFESVIAAAKTEIVESVARYGREAKMDPDLIAPSYAGLLNAFRFNYPDLDGSSLLISIGAKSTDLLLYSNARFYSRNVVFGGNSVTQEISDVLGIPFEEAEALKLSAVEGDPLPTGEYNAFRDAGQNFSKRLRTEVHRTMALAKNQGYEEVLERCLIDGGGSLLPGLESALFDEVKVPVDRFNAFKNIHLDYRVDKDRFENDKTFLSDAVGVAIGRFLPDAPEINLLPRSILWQRKFRRQQPFYIAAGLVACASVALPFFSARVSASAYEQEIQNLDSLIKPMRQWQSQIKSKEKEIKELQDVIASSNKIIEARSNWMSFLNDLQGRIARVEDVWLDRLEIERSAELRISSNKFRKKDGKNSNKKEEQWVKLHLEGRFLDVSNPLSTVSQDSNDRVSELLNSIKDSEYVAALEEERFDNEIPGILKFSFTLIVEPNRPL